MAFRAIASKNGSEFDVTCLYTSATFHVKLEDGTEVVLHETDGWEVRVWTIHNQAEQV